MTEDILNNPKPDGTIYGNAFKNDNQNTFKHSNLFAPASHTSNRPLSRVERWVAYLIIAFTITFIAFIFLYDSKSPATGYFADVCQENTCARVCINPPCLQAQMNHAFLNSESRNHNPDPLDTMVQQLQQRQR